MSNSFAFRCGKVVQYLTLSCLLCAYAQLGSAAEVVKDAAKSPAQDKNAKIVTSHAIAIYDQPKYPANFTHFDYTSLNAVKGGSIKLHSLGTFDSLNPFIVKGTPADRVVLIYDTLTVASSDEPFTRYGLLADKIEYPEDRSWVIYSINSKARFHDGKPVTAGDVVFSFNTLVSKGAPLYSVYYADVKEVLALDKSRVKFIFKNTTNKEIALTVGEIPVFPEHYWKDKAFDQSNLNIPLGSGPYKIKSVDAGRSTVFERVADYWAKDLPVNAGMNNFDQIVVDYYRDDIVATEALKAGQVDYRWERISKAWFSSYDIPAVKNGQLKKQLIRDHSPKGLQGTVLNSRRPPFDNIKVREAFNYAFDFEWANRNLFHDAYTRTDSYFSNSDMASSGLPEGRELEILTSFKKQLPESIFTTAYKNPVTDGSGNNRANLLKAQSLLAEAGLKLVEGKLIDPKTQKPVVVEYLEHDPSFERIINPYIQNLKRLGIEVNIRMVDVTQYINRLKSFDFDMMNVAIGQSASPGGEQRDYWTSAAASTEGSRNYAGIKNPIVDALVESLINAPDRKELVAYTRALDRVLLHHFYIVPQWHYPNHRLVYWDKFAQPEVAPAFDPTFSVGLMTWWIDPDKAKRLTSTKQ